MTAKFPGELPQGQVIKIFYPGTGRILGAMDRKFVRRGTDFGLEVDFIPMENPELAIVSRNGTFKPESQLAGEKYTFSTWLDDVSNFGIKVEFEDAEED